MNKFRNSLVWWIHEGSASEAILRGAYSRHNESMLLLAFTTHHEMSLMDIAYDEVWVRLGSDTWGWRGSCHHIGSWSVNYERS